MLLVACSWRARAANASDVQEVHTARMEAGYEGSRWGDLLRVLAVGAVDPDGAPKPAELVGRIYVEFENAEAAGRVRALDGWTLLCPMTRPCPRSRSDAFFSCLRTQRLRPSARARRALTLYRYWCKLNAATRIFYFFLSTSHYAFH